ncbi:hypothetical protein JTE90_002530 [Oedothorax gibbosus]|uniref:Apolipoprotein L3 n=1 Tax=Oedothorax gibbosus TaxID=931172 RepID=A0AAV6U066_9ARAC|nr:hypothetical protein JTE90_002530 [Oedothorax gibbosus]
MTTRTIQPYNRARPTTLYSDLVETRTYLQKLRAEQPRVAANFDNWFDHRKLTIKTVDRLRQRIDDVSVKCSVAKGIGAVAGIGSAITGLLGLFVEDKETAENLKTASMVCGGASLATLATSTLVEMDLTQSAINEIKRVLQKDIELTKLLRNWIQLSRDIDSRFNRLFDLNIASYSFSSVKKVWQQCIKLLDSGSVSILDLISDLSRLKLEGIENVTREISDKVIYFLKGMLTNPELYQPFVEIWNIVNNDPHTLELAKIGITIYGKTINLLNSEGLLSTVGQFLPIVSLSPSALNVISLASNVVTLILAVKNIQEGASKYSESLVKVKTVLSDELNEVIRQMMTYI